VQTHTHTHTHTHNALVDRCCVDAVRLAGGSNAKVGVGELWVDVRCVEQMVDRTSICALGKPTVGLHDRSSSWGVSSKVRYYTSYITTTCISKLDVQFTFMANEFGAPYTGVADGGLGPRPQTVLEVIVRQMKIRGDV
jgi:hypothetical protein